VSVVFWTIAIMTLITASIAAPGWVTIEREHYKYLVALGVLAAIGQYLLTEAFRSAPPTVVSPFEYTALPWGALIDRLFWHTEPSGRVLLGGGIVVASGLYLMWHARGQAPAQSAQEPWQ
jgi:drug/metabolite transporter (DMT)-like permease